MHYSLMIQISLMLSVVGGLSSSSIYMYWCMLELNTLMFMAMLWLDKKTNSSLSMMKYFLIQSLGTVLMIWGLFMISDLSLMMSMLLKLGVFPFYMWGLDLVMNSSWMIFMYLMGVQKVLPLFFLTSLSGFNSIYILISIMGMVVSCLGSFYKSDLSSLMFYSSLFNMSILLLLVMKSNLVMIMFMMYLIVLIPCWLEFTSTYMINVNMISINPSILMVFLSMGGFPPSIGFFFKWLVFNNMLTMNYSLLICVLVMVMSLYMFYLYLVIIMSSLMLGITKMMKSNKISMYSNLMFSMHLLCMFALIMMMYSLKILFWK
uniref:NADH-ubiquinone oxidoreductase chain 2 n=1 Tax=Caligus clemensi TaxID=344056 RepID=E1B2Q3_CALCM|nr:NADH dehydrogenase subunit 2 [Caligus clemensi]